MTTEVSKWLRKSTLDCIFSEVLLTTDFVEKNNIYAESGMGCTGPIVLVSPTNFEKSKALLIEAKFISE